MGLAAALLCMLRNESNKEQQGIAGHLHLQGGFLNHDGSICHEESRRCPEAAAPKSVACTAALFPPGTGYTAPQLPPVLPNPSMPSRRWKAGLLKERAVVRCEGRQF